MFIVLPTPSLQQLAGLKIVTHLCTGFAAQVIATSKIRSLPLPKTCKKDLLHFVTPLENEIYIWLDYNIKKYNPVQRLNILSRNRLCWTMHGTVDYAKTAQSIAKDEGVDVEIRYEIACVNCLENEARALFVRLANKRKREYVNVVSMKSRRLEPRDLITYFTCTLSGDKARLNRHFKTHYQSINKRFFVDTLCKGTRVTCEYFFAKLSREEKNEVLSEFDRDNFDWGESPTCNFLYYLSLMNERQQDDMFYECIVQVFLFLLVWPMQALFVDGVRNHGLWARPMNGDDRVAVFLAVCDKIKQGSKDYDYRQLFWELWRLTPAGEKESYLEDTVFLEGVLQTKRREFIRLIRENVSSENVLEFSRFYPKLSRDESTSDESSNSDDDSAALETSSDEEDESGETSEEEPLSRSD